MVHCLWSPQLVLDEGIDEVYFKTHIQKIRDAEKNLCKIHAVVGDKVDLLSELHWRLNPAEAVTFCNSIQDICPMFIEGPIRPESAEAMARVGDRLSISIATEGTIL